MTGYVVLRDLEGEDGTRHLEARIRGGRDLIIEGHDLGKGVSGVFGEGISEYEWNYTIKKEDIPLLIKALGGKEGDDVLALIADRCTGEGAKDLEEVIRNNNIPHKSWNHMGD